MRVKLLLLILSLAAMTIALKVAPKKCATLKRVAGKCICYATHAPVCGKSGKTHKNKCQALCAGDSIKHKGACYNVCKKKVNRNRKCVGKKYGRFGKRNWCCTTTTVCWGDDCTTEKPSCGWTGRVYTKHFQHKCTWVRRAQNKREKKCCKWYHICNGNNCYNTKKKCTSTRKESKKAWKNCTKIAVGQGHRLKCCQGVQYCVTQNGKKQCSIIGKKCGWSGRLITYKQKEECGFVNHHKVTYQYVRQCKNVAKKWDNVVDFLSAKQLRKRALLRCKHKDPYVYFSCVFDSSKGLLKMRSEYEQIAQFLKSGNGKKADKNGNRKCASTGDPHIKTFGGKGVNVYNVEQEGRILYQKGNLKVATDVAYDKRWKKRGINVAAYVVYNNKEFLVRAPKNGGNFHKCTGSLKATEKHSKSQQVYTIKTGTATVQIVVRNKGYINVFIIAKDEITHNCAGDCCAKPKGIKGETTWRFGNPYRVVFSKVCDRKASAVGSCVKAYKGNYKKIVNCLRENSKNGKNKKRKKKTHKLTGRRQQCCLKKFKCVNHKCRLASKKCRWKGSVVYKKRHYKCESKRSCKHGRRNRCCLWFSHCTHKGCKTTYKKCFWKGETTYTWKKYKCKWFNKSANVKREQCCHYTKQCKGIKCKIFARKCKWTRTHTTKYQHKCVSKKYGRFGTRKWCCRHRTLCKNKKCYRKSKCKWVGTVKIVRKHYRCSQRVFKNHSCNYCCKWTHKCEKGACTTSEKQCACKGHKVTWKYKERCVLKSTGHNTKQTQCCTWRNVCRNCKKRGHVCKKVDYKCHYVGFPIVISKKQKCVMVVLKDGVSKRLKCCIHKHRCKGRKCRKVGKKCSWKGKIIKKLKLHKCTVRTYKVKGSTRKWCCEGIKICKGGFCRISDKHCAWKGRVTTIRVKIIKKWRRFCKNAKRLWVCRFKRVCIGNQCKNSKSNCKWKGWAVYTHKRVTKVWKWRNPRCKQQYRCVWFTRCVNHHCKTIKAKKCGYVGIRIRIRKHKECKMVEVGKNASRRRCQYWTTICKGKKCVTKHKYVKWVGKIIAIKSTLKCRWKKEKGKKHKYCCRYVMKCYGSKCKNLFAPSCYFTEHFTSLKKKECKWIMISKTGDNWVKRHRCKTWVETCNPKHGCTQGKITFKWGVRISYKTIKTCRAKFFGTNHKKKYCCTKRRICQNGKKCTTRPLRCAFEGNAWLVKERVVLYRWKTICKDQVIGTEGKEIRLKCCRDYQKCVKKDGFYKCKLEQKGKCWWSGAARGDVHLFDGAKWSEVNLQGTIKYLVDNRYGIFTQMSQIGTGTAITALAVQSGEEVVTLLAGAIGQLVVKKDGKVTDKVDLTLGKSGQVKVDYKAKTVVFTLKGEELRVELSEGIFELAVHLNVGQKAEGLFVTGLDGLKGKKTNETLKKICVQSGGLGFVANPECKIISDPNHIIPGIDAEKCCVALKGEDKVECISDCKKTGKCFAKHYQKGEKFLKIR